MEQIETTQVKVKGLWLDVDFSIDVDSIVFHSISLQDSCGEDLTSALSDEFKIEIKMALKNLYRENFRGYPVSMPEWLR